MKSELAPSSLLLTSYFPHNTLKYQQPRTTSTSSVSATARPLRTTSIIDADITAPSTTQRRSSASQKGSTEPRHDSLSPLAESSSLSAKKEMSFFLPVTTSHNSKDALAGSLSRSSRVRRKSLKDTTIADSSSTQAMPLNSVTGLGKPANGLLPIKTLPVSTMLSGLYSSSTANNSNDRPEGAHQRSSTPQLSTETLPPSMMPSGLYSSSKSANGQSKGARHELPTPLDHHRRSFLPLGTSRKAYSYLMSLPYNASTAPGTRLRMPGPLISPATMPYLLEMPSTQIGDMRHSLPARRSMTNNDGRGAESCLHLAHLQSKINNSSNNIINNSVRANSNINTVGTYGVVRRPLVPLPLNHGLNNSNINGNHNSSIIGKHKADDDSQPLENLDDQYKRQKLDSTRNNYTSNVITHHSSSACNNFNKTSSRYLGTATRLISTAAPSLLQPSQDQEMQRMVYYSARRLQQQQHHHLQ
ncbi:hypothetical protein BGZ47_011733 [Haplosporangium gracile]|nr:hypothetical protein BGZ47_011733 [Haplosporangium gracile]